MNNLFTHSIDGWHSWEKVHQSIPAFDPLIQFIFAKEGLEFTEITHCTAGTNAVFRVDTYVIKIYAPQESSIGSTVDYPTELLMIEKMHERKIPTPKLIAHGCIQDCYTFHYIILEYVEGVEFNQLFNTYPYNEKVMIGEELRKITNRINQPQRPFNGIDIIHDEDRQERWKEYPKIFQEERTKYIQSCEFGEKVLVHGDLNGNNILLTPNKEIYMIDFAEAVFAPIVYEHALIACELFQFDHAYIHGYFGEINRNELTKICFDGLLIHDFGGDIIERHLCEKSELINLEELYQKLHDKIISGTSPD